MTRQKTIRLIISAIAAAILSFDALAVPNIEKSNRTVIEVKLNNSNIKTNGEVRKIDKNYDVKPFVDEKSGHVLVPFRSIAEALGYTIEWDGGERTATMKKGTTEMQINTDSSTGVAYHGEKKYEGDLYFYKISIMHDRIYVSLNFISDVLNCGVNWDSGTKSIKITERDEVIDVDFWRKNLRPYKVEMQKEYEARVKNQVIEGMKNTDAKDKISGMGIAFRNDCYSDIFIRMVDNYFTNYTKLYKSKYDASYVTLEFNTIEEAENAVIFLNCWDAVKYAELYYFATPTN